jgi:hypothetical protein
MRFAATRICLLLPLPHAGGHDGAEKVADDELAHIYS